MSVCGAVPLPSHAARASCVPAGRPRAGQAAALRGSGATWPHSVGGRPRSRWACSARAEAVASPAQPTLAETPSVALTAGVAPLLPSQQGVYGMYNAAGELQYIGLTRKLNASIGIHLQDLPERCASAKLLPLPSLGREALQAVWKAWIEEAIAATGDVPVGNTPADSGWTTRKPKASKPEIRLTSGKGLADLTVPLSELINAVVTQNPVVAFIKGTRAAPECGFSKRLILNLEECGCPYEVLNVLDVTYNPGLREAIKVYSAWPTIPQLYAHGEFLGGADITAEMHERGELKTKLSTK